MIKKKKRMNDTMCPETSTCSSCPPEPYTWEWVAVEATGGVISGVAGFAAVALIKHLFIKEEADQTGDLFKEAVEQICNYINKAIDEAFIREYLADTDNVKEQLKYFAGSNGKNIKLIEDIQLEASKLVQRFYKLGDIAIGALEVACSLHLVILKTLANDNPDNWKVPFETSTKEYAEMLSHNANEFLNNVKSRITSPEFAMLPDGGIPPTKLTLGCQFNVDNEPLSFGYGTVTISDDQAIERAREQCNQRHKEKYDEIVNPGILVYNRIMAVSTDLKNTQF
ncbi:hypothetical protein [Bacillus cereus]|uniref:hypothetical protein n=1 Tax=Bacillus cereus TaxID=1396 RepID=UPI00217EDA69|nr:hypothetical protein [Bacillus cereus]MCS6595307.1 hypothetical protein [Bacillus cereus]